MEKRIKQKSTVHYGRLLWYCEGSLNPKFSHTATSLFSKHLARKYTALNLKWWNKLAEFYLGFKNNHGKDTAKQGKLMRWKFVDEACKVWNVLHSQGVISHSQHLLRKHHRCHHHRWCNNIQNPKNNSDTTKVTDIFLLWEFLRPADWFPGRKSAEQR